LSSSVVTVLTPSTFLSAFSVFAVQPPQCQPFTLKVVVVSLASAIAGESSATDRIMEPRVFFIGPPPFGVKCYSAIRRCAMPKAGPPDRSAAVPEGRFHAGVAARRAGSARPYWAAPGLHRGCHRRWGALHSPGGRALDACGQCGSEPAKVSDSGTAR